MTPIFVFLFSVPCLTALFMLTFQLIEEHIDHAKAPQLPFEGFGRPTAKIQFSSFREIVATESALSPLQSWANAGASTSVTPLAAATAQPLATRSLEQQPAKVRAKRPVPALAKRAARPTFRRPAVAMPLVLPNQQAGVKTPTQPAGL